METKFNFKSQICTTKSQSEALLKLGLKKETADMCWGTVTINGEPITFSSEDCWDNVEVTETHIPAWSLHRLIEMTPSDLRGYMCKNIFDEKYAIDEQFDELIATIGYYIKEGYFKKEYLENGNY